MAAPMQNSNRNLSDNHKGQDAIKQQVATAALATIAKYGLDPGTRACAAAHEAGHLIVGLALGGTFESCRIFRHNKVPEHWGGYTSVFNARLHDRDGAAFLTQADPVRSFWLSVTYAAGIAGERLGGMYHPSSSVDEVLTVAGVCGAIGADPLHAHDIAANILLENKLAFDTVRGTLARNRRLLKPEVARIAGRIIARPVV